ncbi:MAG: type II toxin-antitoxin system RelE/ParE family toxin [Deltaproteobacteria bacterium]|nr:type II toxin-antitoxin system RelE/ParE family toxin [Deltaproteobacteria bacterium]
MNIRFTHSARKQFLSALVYTHRDKPSAATRVPNRAETVLRRIKDFPESGRIIPEFPGFPYREVIVSPYRFF